MHIVEACVRLCVSLKTVEDFSRLLLDRREKRVDSELIL